MKQLSLQGPGHIKVQIPHPHVRVEADVLAGSPYIEGSRVPVRRLWAWHQSGVSIDTLLRRYPQLPPAHVLDALSFAYDNVELIEDDLARERELLGQPQSPARAGRIAPEQQKLFTDLPDPPAGERRRRLGGVDCGGLEPAAPGDPLACRVAEKVMRAGRAPYT